MLSFGVDIPDISRRGLDDFTNQLGTYTYPSLDAYDAGQATTYLVQHGNGHTVFLERVLGAFIDDNIRAEAELLCLSRHALLLSELLSRRSRQLRTALRFCLCPLEPRKDRDTRRRGRLL